MENDRISQLRSREEDEVRVDSLTMEYESGSKAVDNLTLSMPRGEIFVLLGHNGAGKTTTISMLTGLLKPTSGTITIFGRDSSAKVELLRRRIGLCPQYNVIYDNLTVREHLVLVGCLKGCSQDVLEQEITQLIADIDLADKQHCFAKNLSGGQKRRLSVAMAFIGGSELIFLDEPTSGMDSTARRYLWQMMRNARSGRVIILTTHFMDEAEFLGDQIAIMSEGRLVCAGSSIFLKNRFGLGYTLTIVKDSQTVESDRILQFVQEYLPEASAKSDAST